MNICQRNKEKAHRKQRKMMIGWEKQKILQQQKPVDPTISEWIYNNHEKL